VPIFSLADYARRTRAMLARALPCGSISAVADEETARRVLFVLRASLEAKREALEAIEAESDAPGYVVAFFKFF
jgi:hypothetical protein